MTMTVDERATIAATVPTRRARSLRTDAWEQFRRHPLALFGSGVLLVIVVGVLVGPFIYPVPHNRIDFSVALEGPSLAHPFGTDDLGRDLLARVLVGGRIPIAVGIVAALLASTVGVAVGLLAGFFGGRIEGLLMRLTDLFLSLPQLPLLLMTVYLFRDSLRVVFGPELGIFLLIVFVIGTLSWMSTARIVRASVLSLREREFVEAARCVGAGNTRIIVRHILPNTLSPVIVAGTIGVGAAIITESALSFLGLGFPADVATWGRLLFDSKNYMGIAPHLAIFPSLVIFMTVMSINQMGDGLRDALDPRLRE